MVCCYILHSRHLPDADKALEFYSQTRTNDKKVDVLFVTFVVTCEIYTLHLGCCTNDPGRPRACHLKEG